MGQMLVMRIGRQMFSCWIERVIVAKHKSLCLRDIMISILETNDGVGEQNILAKMQLRPIAEQYPTSDHAGHWWAVFIGQRM